MKANMTELQKTRTMVMVAVCPRLFKRMHVDSYMHWTIAGDSVGWTCPQSQCSSLQAISAIPFHLPTQMIHGGCWKAVGLCTVVAGIVSCLVADVPSAPSFCMGC